MCLTGPAERNAWHASQRREFIEVADPRISYDDDRQSDARWLAVEYAVLFGQSVIAPHRQDAQSGNTGEGLEHLRARREQACVAAKLVEHKTTNQSSLRFREQLMRPIEVRERATTVDIADEQRRSSRGFGDTHDQ